MRLPLSSADLILLAAQAIEMLGSLLIVGYVVRALGLLLWQRSGAIERTRHLVATGALAGLDFKVAATLLKTLQLRSWSQLGIFAVILGLRFVLKQVFAAEARRARARREGTPSTSHWPRFPRHRDVATPAR